jgi:hypothetical protein
MHDLHVAGSRYEVSVVSQAARDVLTVPGKGARPCAPTTAGTGCCRHPRDDNRHRLKPDDVRSGCSSTHGGDERPFGKHLVLPYPARHPRPPPYALPIPRILHCPRAGAGRGSDDERAPQPGARSARLRRAWCWYQCWREEPKASSRP